MHKFYGNVVLITGASSGIGKSTAEFLMRNGYKVYGTSRKQQHASNLAQDLGSGGTIKMLQMDVCSDESIKSVIDYIMGKEGRIDILINNAGIGIAGSVEDTTTDEAFKQFDTNFFGMHRVVRQVVPIMRKQKRSLIINVSSVAAQFSIPFQSMYSASKMAIEAISEALRIELKPFGIKVAMVEPGDTKTGFTDSRIFVEAANENSVYKDKFTKSVNVMIKDETSGPDPSVVTDEIYKIIKRKNPPIRVIVGGKYKAFVFLKRFLPSKFVSYVMNKMY